MVKLLYRLLDMGERGTPQTKNLRIKNKRYYSLFTFALLCIVFARPSSSFGTQPLSIQVIDGTIQIFDAKTILAYIYPSIYTQGPQLHLFKTSGENPRFMELLSLGDEKEIGLNSEVKILKNGIHIHYEMTALKPLTVINYRASVFFAFKDWIGAPYQADKQKGVLSENHSPDHHLAIGDSGIAFLGPKPGKDDLSLRIEAPGLRTIFQDDRIVGPCFTVIITQGKVSNATYVWKDGEVKTLDFTLYFNRLIVPKTFPKKTVYKGFAGSWQVTKQEGLDSTVNSLEGITAVKNREGNYRVTEYCPLCGSEGTQATRVNFSDGTLHAEFENSDNLDLKIDPTGCFLTGKRFLWQVEWPVKFRKGMDFLAPRFTEDGKVATEYSYHEPENLKDGWETDDLRNYSVDINRVERGISQRVLTGQFPNIQGLVLAQHGKLLLDEYFFGFGPQDLHMLKSASKSIFSIVFGIANDKGLVDIHQKLFDYFPKYKQRPDWDPRKENITLGMILSMTSGFACDDWVPDCACNMAITESPDWLDYTLSKPINHEPGKHWAYCNGCITPAGVIIAEKSGMTVQDFGKKYLFDPLSIQKYQWTNSSDPKGTADLAGGIWLRPRDMAKVGLLILNHGKWAGEQIVSDDWIRKSTKSETQDPPGDTDYGYLWWLETMLYKGRNIRVIEANGSGGQYIFVVPNLDLVCAMTAGNFGHVKKGLAQFEKCKEFFRVYILGSFK